MLSCILSIFKAPARPRAGSVTTNATEKQELRASPSPSPNSGGQRPAPHDAAQHENFRQQMRSQFQKVDTDGTGYISATELQSALTEKDWPPFEIDTVKLLMSIFDTNRDGEVSFEEFIGLWEYIKKWEGVFRRFDVNKSNTIDGDELQPALKDLGYKLSPALQDLLKRKYDVNWGSRDAAAGGGPATTRRAARSSTPVGITFDRFIRACVVVRQLEELFDSLDKDPYGQIKVNYDTFLNLVFKLP